MAKRLRQSEGAATHIPIIFLTTRDATSDKVEGLRLGVDDDVTKPFSVEELVERVKAVHHHLPDDHDCTGRSTGDRCRHFDEEQLKVRRVDRRRG